ncbi:hypothetical protein OG533_02260 [Streptomyces sp. NBC_01186]|uniref:hypothetical protein n=1 Tax=Streptomyces sp. NBC_01186 TaxID=2903765 RepID=UPI002E117FAF|nr:hypothetical protein OG533_02260 [Streptomyces sp. NBC_01186]
MTGAHAAPYTLAPLSEAAVGALTARTLGAAPDTPFREECWFLTGGNPFAVTELLARAHEDELGPHQNSVPRLRRLAAPADGEDFLDRLESLGTACVRLAWSTAVLAGEATLPLAARVAALDGRAAQEAAAKLRAAHVLRPGRPLPGPRGADAGARSELIAVPEAGPGEAEVLEFERPSLGRAVYRAIPDSLRTALHGQAAAAVAGAGLGPAAAARHLLEIHPDDDPAVVEQLRRAARIHLRTGAPEAAYRCLGRALREPPPLRDRPAVLFELGCAALPVTPAATVNHLRAALEEPYLAPELRLRTVCRLAQELGRTGRADEAVRTLEAEAEAEALAETPGPGPGLRLALHAELFMWHALSAAEEGGADEEPGAARDRSRALARLAENLTPEARHGMPERHLRGLRAWDALVRGRPAATVLHHAERARGDGFSWTDETGSGSRAPMWR